MSLLKPIILLFLCLCFAVGPALADRRVALVIGNNAYNSGPQLGRSELNNAKADAAAIAEALRHLGFDVEEVLDADRAGIVRAADLFGERFKGAAVAVFYYAGMGARANGKNYLVPIGNVMEAIQDHDEHLVGMGVIVDKMTITANSRILFMDTCFPNITGQSRARGESADGGTSSQADWPKGTLVSYAAAADGFALDGEDGHSPYAQALLKGLGETGVEINALLRRLQTEVSTKTAGKQVPWYLGSLGEDFYFSEPLLEEIKP